MVSRAPQFCAGGGDYSQGASFVAPMSYEIIRCIHSGPLMARDLGLGGTERQLTELARSMKRSRFEPHVACFHPEGLRGDELRRSGNSGRAISRSLILQAVCLECRATDGRVLAALSHTSGPHI